MGAGFSGALLAHRLFESGYDVTVVDPSLSRRIAALNASHRTHNITPGIPQSAHLHVLLRRGLDLLIKQYPDMPSFLDTNRSPEIDWGLDTIWQGPFGRAPIHRTKVVTRSFSRPLIDRFMLSKIATNESIRLVSSSAIQVELCHQKVDGVMISSGELIAADLVFDCRGKASRFSEQINCRPQGLNWLRPEKPSPVIYRTKLMRCADSKAQIYQQAWPPDHRDGAVLTHIENNQSILTLIHFGRSQSSRVSFDSSIGELGNIEIQDAYEMASEKSGERAYIFKTCTRRTFGASREFPDGLVVLGDALVQFNPVFGQGMSVAADSVETVMDGLASGIGTRQIQLNLERKTLIPWLMSSQTEGSIGQKALAFMLRRSFASRKRHRQFLRVQHLLEHPSSLLLPRGVTHD